jgi:TRAP-type uncharacterized transport system fused permease subunit
MGLGYGIDGLKPKGMNWQGSIGKTTDILWDVVFLFFLFLAFLLSSVLKIGWMCASFLLLNCPAVFG